MSILLKFLPILLCFASVAAAQDVVSASGGFRERVLPNAQVSGDVVMGVMLSSDAASERPPSVITARPPDSADPADPVCVRYISKDGRYTAENTYLVGPDQDSPVIFYEYGGLEDAFLAPRRTATLVTTGRCGSRGGQVLAALWKDPEARPDRLYVYVNAAGNPASIAVGRGEFFAACADETEMTGLKYTARCEVPLEALPRDRPARLTVFVTRPNAEDSISFEVLPRIANG